MKPIAALVNDTVRPFSFPEPVKTVASPIIAIDDGTVGYQRRQADPQAADAQDRRRRPHRAARRQRQRQVDLRQAAGRSAEARDRLDDGRAAAEGGDLRAAPARRSQAGRERLRACAPADAGCARGEGPLARRAVRADDREDGHAGQGSFGRREGAAADGARRLRGAEPVHPRRADQPSRHRFARIADPCAQRLSGRGHPDLARPPSDRGDGRPAVAGQGRHGEAL